jgi:hypothetical protein
MFGMFLNSYFNGDISKWNVSNVEKMHGMFTISQLEKENNTPWWYIEDNNLRNQAIKQYKENLLISEEIKNIIPTNIIKTTKKI